MRMAIGGFLHETNTFIPREIGMDVFEANGLYRGQQLIDHNAGRRTYLGGMIDTGRRLGIDLAPTLVASGGADAPIAQRTYEALRDELLTRLRVALPVDAVGLALHGAGISAETDDIEGDILAYVRDIVGPDVPIVVTLDLHGNITQEMTDLADLLLGVNFYPHVDAYERGVEAVQRAVQIVRGEIRPTAYLALPPMMIPSTGSDFQSVKNINEACWAWEAKPGVLDCTFFHGFGWTDLPRSGVSIYAATDNDPALAKQAAEDVAAYLWNRKGDFMLEPCPPAEAIRRALAVEGRPVVINDGADDPGGGAPGDGTHLLRAMIEADLTDACFGFIVDPETATQAHAAGVGKTIAVRLGGRSDDLHGAPIETDAYVKCLTDGKFKHTTPAAPGWAVNYGLCARLVIGGVDVIVTSWRTQTLDQEVFLLHGIDVMRYKIIALKSSDHFRGAFIPIAAAIIRTDTPGIVSADLTSLPYQRLQRPIWPLDRDIELPVASCQLLEE
jgi:microcystin degradation protein MlrC